MLAAFLLAFHLSELEPVNLGEFDAAQFIGAGALLVGAAIRDGPHGSERQPCCLYNVAKARAALALFENVLHLRLARFKATTYIARHVVCFDRAHVRPNPIAAFVLLHVEVVDPTVDHVVGVFDV